MAVHYILLFYFHEHHNINLHENPVKITLTYKNIISQTHDIPPNLDFFTSSYYPLEAWHLAASGLFVLRWVDALNSLFF